MARREFPKAIKIACDIPGCDRPAYARKLCRTHYAHDLRFGSPTDGGRFYRSWGERLSFIEKAAVHEGDDCLLWPFSHNGNGYPSYSVGKKKAYAHRTICERVHGPAPFPDAQAAHSCGNGHLGCITPRHLSWSTVVDNMADKVRHGTQSRGEAHRSAKLDENSVREIMAMKGKASCRKAGSEFGVKAQTVHDIWSGRSWSHVFPSDKS